jgi:hypothetical protein
VSRTTVTGLSFTISTCIFADDGNIDAVIALAMACERAQTEEQPARRLGWL